jgi:hypothetical protein
MEQNTSEDDDRQRWEHEVGSEPQWVKDMCCLPWVTMVKRNGDIEIIDDQNRVVCSMVSGSAEIRATIANVICDQVNKI